MSFDNHTISIHYAQAVVLAAQRRGLDPTPWLQHAAINQALLSTDEVRITPDQLARLMQAAWSEADDEFLGMTALPCRHGVFTLMAKQAVHCRTLRGVYRHLCRFFNLVSPALRLEFSVEGEVASLSMTLTAPERDPELMLNDFLLLLWHRFPAWLIGRRIPLNRVDFRFGKPGHAKEYRLLFPGPVHYGCPVTRFTFPAELLSAPVVQTPETLKLHLRRAPLDWFKRQNYYPTYTRQVLDALTQDGGFTNLQIDDIAAKMHITSRTLRRKLTDERTAFQELKTLARRDTAIHLLSQRQHSIGAIAHQLGFSEAAAFSRAFKEWTGLEPSRYRDH